MKRRKPEPVITVHDISSAIDEALVALEGNLPQREQGYTLKDGWFTAKEYCERVKEKHQIIKFPANVSRELQNGVDDGKFETKIVRGWDIRKSRRIPLIIYRLKKENPDATVERSKRPVSL